MQVCVAWQSLCRVSESWLPEREDHPWSGHESAGAFQDRGQSKSGSDNEDMHAKECNYFHRHLHLWHRPVQTLAWVVLNQVQNGHLAQAGKSMEWDDD